MGSIGNDQNPWAPYNNYRDCSQAICSIYCPQFCYFFFPPPPPSNDNSTPFSPLIIVVIGVLASAFLLVSYYTIVTRYCNRRNRHQNVPETITNHEADQTQWRAGPSGLDESLIRMIDVREYKRGDRLIEGTECAVCLSEFRENESLRLLPKCKHAFHLPCIDTWLRSQSSCPLCRAGVVVLARPVDNNRENGSQRVDLVLDVDDGEMENDNDNEDNDNGGVKQFGRSVSLDTFLFQRHLLIPGLIDKTSKYLVRVDDGSFEGCERSNVAMKRSVSMGGLIFTV